MLIPEAAKSSVKGIFIVGYSLPERKAKTLNIMLQSNNLSYTSLSCCTTDKARWQVSSILRQKAKANGVVVQDVTFKDLKKKVSLETTRQQSKLFQRLQDKPFSIWDKQQHKLEDIKTDVDCCFNHITGQHRRTVMIKLFRVYAQAYGLALLKG